MGALVNATSGYIGGVGGILGAGSGGAVGGAFGYAIGANIPPIFMAGFAAGYQVGHAFFCALGFDPSAEQQFFDLGRPRPGCNIVVRTVTIATAEATSLSVDVDQPSRSTDQNTQLTFAYTLTSDLAGDYAVTATAPDGWSVELTDAAMIVRPAAGQQSGTSPIRLVARSKTDPSRVAAANISVTLLPTQPGTALAIEADPIFTVPFAGVLLPTAFRATIQNLGPSSEQYALSVNNVTPGWEVITSTTQINVAAGIVGGIGVYLRPTGGVTPPAGTPASFTITVTPRSQSGAPLTRTVSFVMPSFAATVFTPTPRQINLIPGGLATGALEIRNSGNISESVTITAESLANGLQLSDLPQTVTVNPGQKITLNYTLSASSSMPLRTTDFVSLRMTSQAQGAPVLQSLAIAVSVEAPGADAIAEASANAGVLGQTDLAASLLHLSDGLSSLVLLPTDPIANSQAVAALDAVIRIIDAD